jgi:uncharacterized protein (TIGR02679 family)
VDDPGDVSSGTAGDRLERLLGGRDLAWLMARARRRLVRGEGLDGVVTLAAATPAQRAAVQRLLGRPPRTGGALTVSLPAVDAVLRRSGACPDGLAAAVVALTGDVTVAADAVADLERRWTAAFAPLDEIARRGPELAGWVERLRSGGLVRRLARDPGTAASLLLTLTDVVAALPAGGEPLGRFAATHAGGAHRLDEGEPLTSLTLGAARAISGLPDGTGAQWRREVWASVGLLSDEVSSTVLTLGLPGDSRSATGQALAAWRESGQPVVLTLRQLVREPPAAAVRDVFVCENPVVVSEAAERHGAGCLPLVCTGGQPGTAALHLLRHLAGRGATLRHHGDFDWGGIRIGNVLASRVTAVPWRFGAADYERVPGGRALTGVPVAASWDSALTPAMLARGVVVEEEAVVDDLLTDLAG